MCLKETPIKAKSISELRGIKKTCGNDDCGRRFYDLNRDPAACPYCGTPYDAPVAVRHEFEMSAVRQTKGKRYRLEEPAAPKVQDDVAESEVAEDDALASPPDALIDIDDEDENSADEVIGHERPEAEPS